MNIARLFAYTSHINAENPAVGESLEVPGGVLHYLRRGAPDAPVLVLLHGASGNLCDWTSSSVFDALARDWQVIAFDRPSYGYSQIAMEQAWMVGPQVEAMRAAMRMLGHDRYAIFGHSYGVAVGLEWALRYPENVTGLISMSGAMASWGGALGWRYRWGGRWPMGWLMSAAVPLIESDALLRRELAEVFAPQSVPSGYVREGAVRLALRPATFANNLRAMDKLHAQTRHQLPQIRSILCPGEVIHGEKDAIVPLDPSSQPIATLSPAARLTVLKGIGHMPHHAVPDRICQIARRLRNRIQPIESTTAPSDSAT